MSDHHFLHPTREPAGSLGARLFLPAALLVSVTMLPATTGGGSSSAPVTTTFPGATSPSGQWPYPNGDLANTREAPGSVISSANVSQLREAWAFKLTGKAAAGVSPYRLADRRPGRDRRRGVPTRPGRQRVRAGARHGPAEVGVPGERPGGQWPRA